jgi:hypothetical protein
MGIGRPTKLLDLTASALASLPEDPYLANIAVEQADPNKIAVARITTIPESP